MMRESPRVWWLRIVMAVFAIALLLTTEPLWIGAGPRIPWLSSLVNLPLAVETVALGLLAVGLLGMIFAPRSPRATRMTTGLMTLGLVIVAGFDQHRLQPWVWQLMLMGTVLTLAPDRTGLTCCRAIAISVYIHSAFSKCDVAFLESHGQMLLLALVKPLGMETAFWTESTKTALAAVFPAGELLAGLLLCFQRTRRWGLAASLLMHLGLLWTLGIGLQHGRGVLIWNLYWIAQNLLLFWPEPVSQHVIEAGRLNTGGAIAGFVTTVAVLFPFLENWGDCDHWPAWAVYCARPAQVRVLIEPDAAAALPDGLAAFLRDPELLEDGVGVPLSLESWSFETRRCPIYPQQRYRLALTLALLSDRVPEDAVTVQIRSTPHRWTGHREEFRLHGLNAVRSALEGSLVNVLPRRGE